MAPICKELEKQKVSHAICVTAQHREMMDQVLEFFELKPEYDLDLMEKGQALNRITSLIFSKIDKVFDEYQPDVVMVQGDTTTAFATGMAAFYRQIKIAHVEAGLRTYNRSAPYPEEANRQLITRIADYHFAPTKLAVENLTNERIPLHSISVTGNTVIDALEMAISKIKGYPKNQVFDFEEKLDPFKKIILITGHRRENFGEGLNNICAALLELAASKDIQIVYPVHLNPRVKKPVMNMLKGHKNIILSGPVNYPVFLWLMQRAALIISDSGGIQEEAPSFQTPVLVTREFTERMEGVEAGFSFVVGTDKALIVEKAQELINKPPDYKKARNPYGDGKAAERIVDFLCHKL